MEDYSIKSNIPILSTVYSPPIIDDQVTIRDFDKIALLGIGAFGSVHLVKNKKTKHPYAMKILKKEYIKKKVNGTLTECKILMQADHPFISSLYFCFQTELNLYIIMQYCAGGDFYNVIQRQPDKCLTIQQTQFYSACVLLALEYLHTNGIIYRDLKPENILMRVSGHIVLTDFNLSTYSQNKVVPKVVIKPYSHHAGVCAEPSGKICDCVGTPEYMAPEIINGSQYSAVVDWWAFGILIFEMLYGVTPFKGKDNCGTCKAIRNCHLNFMHHTPCGEKLSSKVKKLIKELVVFEPEKRLGFNGGATDIKDHPFFNTIEFQLLRNQIPPIIPTLSNGFDHHYFKSNVNNRLINEEDCSNIINPETLKDDDVWKVFKNISGEICNPHKLYS